MGIRGPLFSSTSASSTPPRASRSGAQPSTSGTPTPRATTLGFGAGRRSRTFMRGIQRTKASGIATFLTVYPGWYQGRAVHIHVKVHVSGSVVHIGQLFFPDALTDRVYRRAPYNKRPNRTTRNPADSIFVNGGRKSMLALSRRRAGGYLGEITMGVHRS